jgi:hypothetical protein
MVRELQEGLGGIRFRRARLADIVQEVRSRDLLRSWRRCPGHLDRTRMLAIADRVGICTMGRNAGFVARHIPSPDTVDWSRSTQGRDGDEECA